MTIRNAITGFMEGLRKADINVIPGLNIAPQVPVAVSGIAGNAQSTLAVVDTLQLPTANNVPGSWSRQWMGPGRPFVFNEGMTFSDQEKEMEPRAFQYIASVNSTISPRLAYSLMSFAELKWFASNVPEVALCLRLPTEELKSFIPTIVDDDDNKVDIPELQWMTERPDRVNPWPVWLSRFLYNVLVYDAPALYKMRASRSASKAGELNKRASLVNLQDGEGVIPMVSWHCQECGENNYFDYTANDLQKCVHCESDMPRSIYKDIAHDDAVDHRIVESPIVGLRIIDGSTIFSVIDERGEQPQPPAPAFTQVIWGVPRMYLNTNQLWYRPRHLRPDAPYGRTFIEDALPAVKLLSQLWEYEGDKYLIGNIPEMGLTAPADWKSAEQILEFEEAFNSRMAGNTKERAGRIRFFPSGTATLVTKEMTFNRETYDAASNAVRIAAGIPKSEVGEAPEGMLGGKGFAEAMTSGFYRMCISPLITFVEGAFNEAIEENGYQGVYFKLKFPNESIDPEKEETKFATRFTSGGITRDEYRESIGLGAMGGEEGKFIFTPGNAQQQPGEEGGAPGGDPFGAMFGGKANGKNGGTKKPVQVDEPIDVIRKPIAVKKIDGNEAELVNQLGLIPADETPSGIAIDEALELGNRLGVDWSVIPLESFKRGLQEEQEHAGAVDGDQTVLAQIALDHLREDPAYYDKLAVAMAKMAKTCGVDMSDDAYFGAPITARMDVEMPHQGANDSLIVGIGGLGQEIVPAVWKPVDGEDASLQDWIGGELYRRSEAVYLVDRELAKDVNHYLVPVTWCDNLAGVDGSVQMYVQGRKPKKFVTEYAEEYIEQAAVLDFITGQVDRMAKNYLTHPTQDNRPVLIDNDLSFPIGDDIKLRSSFVDMYKDKELSPAMKDSIYLLVGNIHLWQDLDDILQDVAAVKGAQERSKVLLECGMIPSVAMNMDRIAVEA